MSITPVNMRTGLLLVVLCLFGAGCVHYSTPAERDASFSPYKEAEVEEVHLRNYLFARAAFLFEAESVQVTSSRGTNSIRFKIKKPAGGGTATPIDQRGYFLTAAHCVEKGQVWLAFLQDTRFEMERARIVWRGDRKKGGPDLAILCVPQQLSRTFQWAAEFTNGSPVVDVGLNWDDHSRDFEPQCMAGRILEVSEALKTESSDYRVITHSSPLHHGDSGGPVLLPDGRLLGINVMGTLGFQWSHLSFEAEHSEAHRPDLAWLRKVIDADAASFSREISAP
jgi:hypothetical protein